jgi:rare lipoprotein A
MSIYRVHPALPDTSPASTTKRPITPWHISALAFCVFCLSVRNVHAGVDSAGIDPGQPAAIASSANRSDLILVPVASRAALMGNPTVFGTASMYNPFRPGYQSGGIETASGEPYDPAAWTAAIKSELRGQFGGVRYGKNYQIAYALVEGADKRVVVKINDVGPLKPGRVIDFNERTMRYFDPTLQLGLIDNVSITPLPGDNWRPGPVTGSQMVKYCSPLGKRFSVASEISDLFRILADRPLDVECGATVDWEPRLLRLMTYGPRWHA